MSLSQEVPNASDSLVTLFGRNEEGTCFSVRTLFEEFDNFL
jgi:hypothetical protein